MILAKGHVTYSDGHREELTINQAVWSRWELHCLREGLPMPRPENADAMPATMALWLGYFATMRARLLPESEWEPFDKWELTAEEAAWDMAPDQSVDAPPSPPVRSVG